MKTKSPLKAGKAEITEVAFIKDKRHPVLVGFQNGQLLPQAIDRLPCGMYREKKSGDRVVAVATDSCVYSGKPVSNDLCRTLLAIRNKITNKVEFGAQPSSHLVCMKRGWESSSEDADDFSFQSSGECEVRLLEVESANLTPFLKCDKPATETQDRLEAYSELNKKFGSKRVKRRVEQGEAMRLEVDHMEKQLSQALNESAKNVLTDIKSSDASSPAVSTPGTTDDVLPCNRNATSPDKIYDINDFISQEELDSFHDEAQKLAANNTPDSSYTEFFKACLKQVPPETSVQSIKILLYAECLVRFVNLTYKDFRSKTVVVCRISESVNKRILNSFTVPSDSGRTRPLHVRDKAICHIIALGLMANNFKLNLEPLLSSIKIGGTRLQQLCKAVGAMPTAGNKNLVVLKAPLPPMIQNTPARGGGRRKKGAT